MLLEFIMGGHFDVVKSVLRTVLDYLSADNCGALVPVLPLEQVLRSTGGAFQRSVTASSTGSSVFGVSPSANAAAGDAVAVFTSADAVKLSELLSRATLPDLSRKFQMHLLAVVDTFRQIMDLGSGLDASGTRFFISLKMFQFLRKTQSAAAPPPFAVSNWAWALQSQAHDTLLTHMSPSGAFSWADVRTFGVPLWLRNPERFKAVVESVAKSQFTLKKASVRARRACTLVYVRDSLSRAGPL